jgi:glutamine cyclotransferase
VASLLAAGCVAAPPAGPGVAAQPQPLRAQVLEVRPHDRSSFTQGFELVDGVLYEGTGLAGQSAMLATDPATGRVLRRAPLPAPLFGEGITVVGDRVWQLTWTDGIAIERDLASFAELRRVPYEGEGWGLCHDGARLVMSDGTDRLTFRDPSSFAPLGEVRVRNAGSPVRDLNELECDGGAVYANVWKTDKIIRVDPASGGVTAVIDAAGLLPAAERPNTDVLNGIAAIPHTQEFLLTGKHWPHTYRVTFTP